MRDQEKLYIEDNFKYLVSHVGFCTAKYLYHTEYPHWVVHINGRMFVEQTQQDLNSTSYVFICKITQGTISVSFARKDNF